MAQYTKPLDLYKAQKKRFEQLALTRRQGFLKLQEAMLADAKELTSGEPMMQERLVILRSERPFARNENPNVGNSDGLRRGGGKGSLPLLPIGVLSGRLRRTLKVRPLPKGFGLFAPGVEYAQFILGSETRGDPGTTKMVARGFQKVIRSRFKARWKAFLDHYRSQEKK